MISLIEALNYRCLRHIQQGLGPFQVLVGPNASGKTTFLDVIGFLGDLVHRDALESSPDDAALEGIQDLLSAFFDFRRPRHTISNPG